MQSLAGGETAGRERRGEGEGVGWDPGREHLREQQKGLGSKVEGSVGVDEGAPGEDGGVRGEVEEGLSLGEEAEGGVATLELEEDDAVVMQPGAEDRGVDFAEVAGAAAAVDEAGGAVCGLWGRDDGHRGGEREITL